MPGDWAGSLYILLLVHSALGSYQNQNAPTVPSDPVATARSLFAEGKWDAVVQLVRTSQHHSADLDYYQGMALARLEKWEEAKQAFQTGQRKAPADKRFPLELGGIAFKQRSFSEARAHLERALRLDPQDSYGNDFVATLYFLADNLEAALKYWNRAGKPRVEEIRIKPQLRIRPALLDRAFAFAPASRLEMKDFLTTQARLELLGIFPQYRLELAPNPDQSFNVLFHSIEKNGWGGSKTEGITNLARGVPFLTVHPEFFNIRRSAINFVSLLRWDAQKRRYFASLSGPLRTDPKWRFRSYLDGRIEKWNLTGAVPDTGLQAEDLHLQKLEAAAEIQAGMSGTTTWKSGVSIASRRFKNIPQDPRTETLFAQGVSLKYELGIERLVLAVPERRLNVRSFGSLQLARLLARRANPFSKLESGIQWNWFTRPQDNDYLFTGRFRAGKTIGSAPFDELFSLGLERDNDLGMRGHHGTRDGKKGAGPLGRDYVLLSSEIDKTLYESASFSIRLGPLVDTGKIFDESQGFGSGKWLCDIGVQSKMRFLSGLTVVFSYARDLRSGGGAFYAIVTR